MLVRNKVTLPISNLILGTSVLGDFKLCIIVHLENSSVGFGLKNTNLQNYIKIFSVPVS